MPQIMAKPDQHIAFRKSLRELPMQLAVGLFLVMLVAQSLFWFHTRSIKPEMGIVPDVPGEHAMRALAFGDEEAFFRLHALGLQNSGDTFGRFTALYKYDFNKLYHWFVLLGTLNNESDYLPAMASYYFSQTQNAADVTYVVRYLDEYTRDRAKEKWWWVTQGAYLATHKLKDKELALALASRLVGVRGIPLWAQQLPAFIHEQRGEFGEALAIIEEVLKNPEEYDEGELNFMRYFVDERLNSLDKLQKEFEAAKKEKDKMRATNALDVQPNPTAQ